MFKYTNLFQKKNEQSAPAANPQPAPASLPPRGGGFYPGAGQQAAQQASAQQQAAAPAQAPAKTSSGFNLKTYLLYALLIGLGVALAKTGFDYVMPMFMNKPAAKVAAKKPAAAALPIQLPFVNKPAAEPAKTAAPKSAPLTSAGFTVSGIFVAEDPAESTAIINNQIVSPGAAVDKAMVMEINMDGVVLEKDGQTIKISNR